MRSLLLLLTAAFLRGQTADELIAKNLQAKGGIDKIKAIRTLRISGKLQQGSFTAKIVQDTVAPNLLRQMVTIQGMTQVQAYDGTTGWQIDPFEGRRDPELLGEDQLRGLVEEADFYGPLVDYKSKDNRAEYLGIDKVDGDDAYRLKVTLANGDIFYYYLDPDTYLEIRVERVQYIRGAVRESFVNYGSYKQVAGVYYPFSLEAGNQQNPQYAARITFDKIDANAPIDAQEFKMPSKEQSK